MIEKTNSLTVSRSLPSDWPQRRREVLQRDEYMCRNCERHEDMRGVSLEVHHIVPRRRGGTHHKANLMTLCEHCHDRVHNGSVTTPDNPLGYVDRLREEVRSFQWRQANVTDIDPRSIARKVGGTLPDQDSIKLHTGIRRKLSDPTPRTFPNFVLDVGTHVTEREAACAE